jgi:hypothetical protein
MKAAVRTSEKPRRHWIPRGSERRLHPRRRILSLAAGAAALPAVSRMAWAQAYPSRPVRIIVGFPAGASARSRPVANAIGVTEHHGVTHTKGPRRNNRIERKSGPESMHNRAGDRHSRVPHFSS